MEEKVRRKAGRMNRESEGEKEVDHMQGCVYGFATSHAYHCADL